MTFRPPRLRNLCSIAVLTATHGLIGCGISGCSDDDVYARSTRLDCTSQLDRCDVRSSQCRQRIFDRVGCMRRHTKRETPPPVEFIKLSELLSALQEAETDDPDPDAEAQREALSLLGLVAPMDVAATEAVAERLKGLAALYIPESQQVIIIEDPDGAELTEEELGLPVEVFNMSVLAHEYVHAYQDLEFDLQQFQKDIPDNFDGQLAAISAVEGEATLYEYEFLLNVLGRQQVDRRDLFEELIDSAEDALTESDSPWLAARGIFPYTYGAHSAWTLTSAEGPEAAANLRESRTTLGYIDRRYGPTDRLGASPDLQTAADAGFARVVLDDLGAWLLNGFTRRLLNLSAPESLGAARQWIADEVTIWRGPGNEVLVHWVLAYAPFEQRGDAGVGAEWSWSEQARQLASLAPPIEGSGWLVSARGGNLVITASTDANSAALSRLHAANTLPEDEVDAGASGDDAGVPLPSFTYQRVAPPGAASPQPLVTAAKRAKQENVTRRRLLRAVASSLTTH